MHDDALRHFRSAFPLNGGNASDISVIEYGSTASIFKTKNPELSRKNKYYGPYRWTLFTWGQSELLESIRMAEAALGADFLKIAVGDSVNDCFSR